MPYSYHKEGDKYVVTKKDTGKVVGHTKGTKEALKKYLAALHINANEDKVNEGTPEQEKIKKVVTDYINLRKAIDNPNYPDTPHTYSAMKKVESLLQQMNKKASLHYSLLKILPVEYHDILNANEGKTNTMKKSELREMIAEIIKEVMNESVDYDTAVAYRLTVKGDRDAAMANVKSLLDNLTTGKSKKFPEVKVVMLPSKGNPQDIILKLNGPGAFSMSKDIKARPELKGIKVSTYKPQLSKIS